MKSVDLRDVHVTVLGAERSGIAAATLLSSQGAKIFVSDSGTEQKLRKSTAQLQKLGIRYETGSHSERVYDSSLIVVSPGVPTNAPVVVEAQRRGIRVVAEIEIASWFCRAPVIAITGSNGKTTTATLLGRIFSDAKKKHVVAGNIGTAFSSLVLDVDETGVVVLEVSSFQLELIEQFKPSIAVVLNITQNHMDRYDHSMEKYAVAKARIFMNQTSDDMLIYNAEDLWTQNVIKRAASSALAFSTKKPLDEGAFVADGALTIRIRRKQETLLKVNDISITGEHNLQDAMAAALAAQLIGVSPASLRATLKNFKGVEHRQEFVGEVNGIKYVNNSKATTVEAVESALKSYDEPIVLILGGKDKGNNYSPIFDLVKRKVRAIVATGHSADIVVKNFSDIVPVVKVDTIGTEIPNVISMEKTIATATALAHRGDLVLLAPACTSFDWFTDFEERGNIFKKLVQQLA